MKNLLLSSVFAMTFAMLCACGDDVTEVNEVTEIHQDGIAILAAGDSLGACTAENVGDMLFVTDSSEVFVCNGKTWQTLKGADGKDGKDGVGKDGKPGDDGESCTAKPVKNDAGLEGFEVACGKTVIDTVWNGTDGDGCSVKDEGDGMVAVSCGEDEPVTLYKAVCGTEPYDPAKSFCSDGKLYELCDGKTYDPTKSLCSDGKLYSCNDEPYDPKEQYCLKVTRGETDIYRLEALLTDARDDQHIQIYKTVKICNDDTSSCQTWMAQNLNYAYNKGTAKSYCYNDDTTYCDKYGRLYLWSAAMDSAGAFSTSGKGCGEGITCSPSGTVQGVCPEGWHLPSKAEWDTLFTNVGERGVAAGKLKSEYGWNGSGNGEDTYGFAVLPAGDRYVDGNFSRVGDNAYFWSSTEYDSDDAYEEAFGIIHSDVYEFLIFKFLALSVRCLKNK